MQCPGSAWRIQSPVMSWNVPADLENLVARVVGRRREVLSKQTARERGRLAEDLAHRGLGQSGAMIVGIAKVYADAFQEYGEGVTKDILDLLAPDGTLQPDAAKWARDHVEPLFDRVAAALAESVAEGRTTEGLRDTAAQAIEKRSIRGKTGFQHRA
jgi:hypothetical protein